MPATSCAPPAARFRCIRDLRFGLARVGPLARRFRANAARPGAPGDPRAAGLGGARRGAARSASPRPPTSAPISTSTAATTGSALFAGPVLGLLRRFHNLTRRTFVPTQAAARELGRRRLPPPHRRRPRRRHRALHAGAPQRRAARAVAGRPETPVLLDGRPVAAEKNVELGAARVRAGATRPPRPAHGRRRRRSGASRGCSRRIRPRASSASQRGAELAAHYASADLFLFPSLSDTFGNVVMEALASGLPVVSFDCRRGRPSTSTTASAAGSSRPATKPASSPPRPRSLAAPGSAANRCATPPSPRRAAPPGTKCSSASRPACRTPSMRSEASPARVPVVA